MVRPGRTVEPDPKNVARYEEIYQRYLRLYPAAKGVLGT
jgi:sugar (pentulose or hexulose) kinase